MCLFQSPVNVGEASTNSVFETAEDIVDSYTEAPVVVLPRYEDYYKEQMTSTAGRNPLSLYCPICEECITSSVSKTAGSFSCWAAGIMFIAGLSLCAWMPFCIDRCKDTDHFCPQCKVYLGTHEE